MTDLTPEQLAAVVIDAKNALASGDFTREDNAICHLSARVDEQAREIERLNTGLGTTEYWRNRSSSQMDRAERAESELVTLRESADDLVGALEAAREFVLDDKDGLIENGSHLDEDYQPIAGTLDAQFAKMIAEEHDPLLAKIDAAISNYRQTEARTDGGENGTD